MSNKQQIITAKQRQLLAKWAISSSINEETIEEMQQELVDILQEEIQLQSLFEQCVTLGWYGFRKEPTQDWPEADVVAWCKKHCVGLYINKPGMCIFENKDDATKFTLTWC